jgi:hypothetical protein
MDPILAVIKSIDPCFYLQNNVVKSANPNRRLWSQVPNPFSYHECAARSADLSDALVMTRELTRSHAGAVREALGEGEGAAPRAMDSLLRGLYRRHNDFVLRTVPRAKLIPACWWDFPKDTPLLEVLSESDGGTFMRETLGIGSGSEGGETRAVVPGKWQAWCNWAEEMHL